MEYFTKLKLLCFLRQNGVKLTEQRKILKKLKIYFAEIGFRKSLKFFKYSIVLAIIWNIRFKKDGLHLLITFID